MLLIFEIEKLPFRLLIQKKKKDYGYGFACHATVCVTVVLVLRESAAFLFVTFKVLFHLKTVQINGLYIFFNLLKFILIFSVVPGRWRLTDLTMLHII